MLPAARSRVLGPGEAPETGESPDKRRASRLRRGLRDPSTQLIVMTFLSALLSSGSIIDLDGTFFLQLAIFVVAFFVLRALLFKPAIALFEAREEAIEGAARDALQFEREAEEKETAFAEQMRDVRLKGAALREELRAKGKADEAELLSEVRSETDKELTEAEAQLTKAAEEARAKIQAETPALARQIASKLLDREVA